MLSICRPSAVCHDVTGLISSSSSHALIFFSANFLRDLADGWLVLAVVAQEDIKDFHLGT